MSTAAQWALFAAVGLGTFAIRLSFIELSGWLRLPPLLNRALAYVPASVLAALVLPAVVFPGAGAEADLLNPRVPAAILAAIVAWFSKSTLMALGAGMGALWLLQYLGA
ncbi:AzlD domain-containing protein [Pseudomonas sp. LRF_L74]|uniref:AzlD domain-containing protein n=1 Tax=Pseudomonas sp. LRF_L74 TaxID=3369422 RepID=UPI003F5E6EC4